MPTNKSKLDSWILTLLIAGVVVLFFVLVFLPTRRTILEMRAALKEKRDYITNTGMLPAQIETAERKLQTCAHHNQDWRAAAGDESGVPQIFALINQEAKRAGATTTRFEPHDPAPLETVRRFPVTLGVQGEFDEVFQFLSQLEQLPHTIWLEDLHLESAGKDRKEVACTAKLVIFTDKTENSN